MGNIISPDDLKPVNKVRLDYLKRHYNSVTAENQMKPSYIAPLSKPATNNWTYRFAEADNIVNAARNAEMSVVGHTLIWHRQTPAWLTTGDKAAVTANLEKYVTEVTTHFKEKIIAWDVVNEAFRDGLNSSAANGDWKECLRKENTNPPANDNGSAWNRIIGPEYIELAFLKARTADPGAMLYYNDYNLNSAEKALAVYNMVKDINERYPNVGGRKLIDGIGMQSHHHLNTNPQTMENSIILFASLGVEISITELDIIAADNNEFKLGLGSWKDSNAQQQAAHYAAMFRIFKNHSSKIRRVTFWGLDDGTSWRKENYPTLLDRDYGLKPAFYAVANPQRY